MVKNKVLYILSQPKSGSTLLAYLLNAHPHLFTVGETARTTNILTRDRQGKPNLCSCGADFQECLFWKQLEDEMRSKGWDIRGRNYFNCSPFKSKRLNILFKRTFFDFKQDNIDFLIHQMRLKYLFAPVFRPQKYKLRRFYSDFYTTLNQIIGSKAYVDSSKSSGFLAVLNTFGHVDLRVINLVRDGRALVHSWAKRSSYSFMALPDKSQVEKYIHYEKTRKTVLANLKSAFITVKYEDLASDPKFEIKRILEFAGIHPVEYPIENFKSRVPNHLTGNQMIANENEVIHKDERWRNEISHGLLDLFENSDAILYNKNNGYVE